MLFNSNLFLFAFLPVVLLGFFTLARSGRGLAVGWLVGGSLFFYAWWNPVFLPLLLGSVVVNHALGHAALTAASRRRARAFAAAGVVFDLGAIAWFKYANFFAETASRLTGVSIELGTIALPLAISFFTFQQIAYLADCARGRVAAGGRGFLNYCLFVTFFPQLISGPIVHHAEMMPQFERRPRFRAADFNVGLTFLVIGLFKKVVLADGIASHSSPIFDAAVGGETITFFEGWAAALGYTLQLYFDFSGYSDMAVGLARMFGIKLPFNFHSPLKSPNIIEFWRRWHMTLSRFLRDYLYFTLGGNRRGAARRYLNLFVTMLLGGLWHGAAWTFVLWGAIHGVYLMANHAWNAVRRRLGVSTLLPRPIGVPLAHATTFLAVVVAFVLFRAASIDATLEIFRGMLGWNGALLRPELAGLAFGLDPWIPFVELRAAAGATRFVGTETLGWVVGLLAIAWALPNTQQLLDRYEPGLVLYGHSASNRGLGRIRWEPSPGWTAFTSILLLASIHAMMTEGHTEFLYRFF